ncbi:MAG: ABC transporter ATP-binding protein [candidate division Zixibacteria bacterium RBG_16_50_21]|nr:MAG: ABC transporter ATP-binding protein [candidate division Zixibacteria bacterium RBG_16_50_21]
MNSDTTILELQDLHVYYGAIHALKGISLSLKKGEIVCLIGANGAGKSTTLNAISGIIRPRSGKIVYQGEIINRCPPHKIVQRGISQAPEGRKIFANLSVLENLELGAYLRRDSLKVKSDLEKVFTLFPRLKERRKQSAGTLSGGEQQMLAIGRALMSNPVLLLLDEPSLGLAPLLVKQIFQTIVEINQLGTTILLVEQNAHMALHIAQRGYVIETGKVALEDKAQNLLNNQKVKEAYLGG